VCPFCVLFRSTSRDSPAVHDGRAPDSYCESVAALGLSTSGMTASLAAFFDGAIACV
jgi:hypothetical protein